MDEIEHPGVLVVILLVWPVAAMQSPFRAAVILSLSWRVLLGNMVLFSRTNSTFWSPVLCPNS